MLSTILIPAVDKLNMKLLIDHQHSNSNDNSLQSQSPRPPNPTSTKMTSTSSNSASSGSAGGIGGAKPFKRINSDFHPPPPILSNAYSNDGMGGGGDTT